MAEQLLSGLRVVELASVLAGPAVGMFLAELGAQVVKIENKTTGGDVTRIWKLPGEDPDSPFSAYYHSVNWGKQVLMVDLRREEEREKVEALIRQADVVISNFRKRSAKKLGMDYERLQRLNPVMIFAHLSAFGEDEERPGFDVVLQAESGFMFMTGEPGRPPVKMPVALIDLQAAHQLKEAILLALLRRERTGRGAYVSVSLLESAIASLANQATNWLMAGHIPQAMGSLHPNIAPYGEIFFSRDGQPVVIAVGSDDQFRALCEVLGLPHLFRDPRFSRNVARVEHRQELGAALAPAFEHFEREDLLSRCEECGIPAGAIRNMQEVFELPAARNMILEEILPDGSPTRRVKTVAFDLK